MRSYQLILSGLTVIIAAPLLLVASQIFRPSVEIWLHLWETRLLEMLSQTVLLVAAVGLGTLLLGTGLAWLVSAYHFPGRAWFAWMLVLPLAMPSYVLGFVFMATFDFAGPVQTTWRDWFGFEAWFPEIRSLGGAALVLTLVWYPYVYLLARAAFAEQSALTFDAAQAMGLSRSAAFVRLVLPLARPSLAAGVTLVMLETLTDFATVRYFNVLTVSEGVYRVWEGMMDRAAALELATLLLLMGLSLVLLERGLRGQGRYTQPGGSVQRLMLIHLQGWRAGLATASCLLVLARAFGLPSLQLMSWTLAEAQNPTLSSADGVAGRYIAVTLGLALGAALLTGLVALFLAACGRLVGGRFWRGMIRIATLGYALPGAVIAVGTLSLLAMVDQALLARDLAGSLILTGSLAGLLYAYMVRFVAIAHSSTEASLDKVTPQLVEAARCMGAGQGRIMRRVHTPLVRAGLLAGALLVFVDVMKELPVTLMLRPFGMDTLAIWTYMLAAESFWQAAAFPALIIVTAGVLPVVLLVRAGDRLVTR
ncbi:MAG: ABC transporter permease [Oscillochloridaceae bacterium umkhey_bin13]